MNEDLKRRFDYIMDRFTDERGGRTFFEFMIDEGITIEETKTIRENLDYFLTPVK